MQAIQISVACLRVFERSLLFLLPSPNDIFGCKRIQEESCCKARHEPDEVSQFNEGASAAHAWYMHMSSMMFKS